MHDGGQRPALTCAALKAQFAEVFADLDAVPRPVEFAVYAEGFVIDLVAGEPKFVRGKTAAQADFRGRWLAEHPVPVALRRKASFSLVPTTGNRVKVRIRQGVLP